MNELSQAQPAGAGDNVTSVRLSRRENPIISFLFCFSCGNNCFQSGA
jgi:hypothetical protein